jgi:hypothetical protein
MTPGRISLAKLVVPDAEDARDQFQLCGLLRILAGTNVGGDRFATNLAELIVVTKLKTQCRRKTLFDFPAGHVRRARLTIDDQAVNAVGFAKTLKAQDFFVRPP